MIRKAAVAGQFYPGTATELKKTVSDYLQQAETLDLPAPVRGLIAPHAGYVFSGQTAAHAYTQLRGQTISSVIIVAPSHQEYFPGVLVYSGDGYETPLGLSRVDRELAERLLEAGSPIHSGEAGHRGEHSLEVQVPFIQTLDRDISIVPAVMGDQDLETCTRLAEAMAGAAAGDVLLVASSDLSHFHPYEEARRLDQVVNDHINNFDPEGLARALEKGECEACGGGPMIAVMLAAKKLGASTARVVHHVNSGDIIEDKSGVVGYTSAVIY